MYLSVHLRACERSLIYLQPNQYHGLQVMLMNYTNWNQGKKVHLIIF